MATVGEILKGSHWFTPISETEKRCEKHGIDYTEQVFKHFVRGCSTIRLSWMWMCRWPSGWCGREAV